MAPLRDPLDKTNPIQAGVPTLHAPSQPRSGVSLVCHECDCVAKVRAVVPQCRRSDHAPNEIPHGAVVRNMIPRRGLIGFKILSVDGALDVTQGADRLL